MTDESLNRLLDVKEQKLALELARSTLALYLSEGRLPEPDELGIEGRAIFFEKRAAFVSLHKGGALRGCIGHILPIESLWRSIRSNAVSAAVKDRRFAPVKMEELPALELEVSVLTVPRPIDEPLTFEVGRHGILMERGGNRAVFLPQVAPEQGWDAEATLNHLSLKAGLDAGGWRDPSAKFKIFSAQVIK